MYALCRLHSSLAKCPVPALGKEYTLNLEKILEKGKESEAVLQPTRRQVAELEKELEREMRAKQRDENELKELTKNAKRQEQVRAEKIKTVSSWLLRMFYPILIHLLASELHEGRVWGDRHQ